MTRDDVKNAMHDYFDGLLSPEEKSSIESYLEEYVDIAAEYELLQKILNKAQSLPIGIKTPGTIIQKVSDELLSQSLERIESEKQQRLREITENVEKEGGARRRLRMAKKGKKTESDFPEVKNIQKRKGSIKTPLTLIIILLLCVGGYFLYDYFSTNLPWQVKAVYGQYQVGDAFNKKVIDLNEKLITQDSTKVTINIPTAGTIDVRSYSSIQVVKGKTGDNIISLLGGKIDATCNIDRPGLEIKTIQATLDVIGGDFAASLTDLGDLFISTGNGIVNISNNKETVRLVRDHICKVLGNGDIGIPYYFDTDPRFIELLDKISFGNGSITDVDILLNMATPLDGISLLYLLKAARNSSDRLPIFLKLNELYPIVPGITQDGILNLDLEMIELWQNDIEWQI